MNKFLSDKLDANKIRLFCQRDNTQSVPRIHLFESIDSTNEYLKTLPYQNTIDICCANMQTHGRGRLGRQWHSPPEKNIYCSMRWKINHPLSKLSALSLVSALAILSALRSLNAHQNIQVKWPNDLYWYEKKLGGILIESIAETKGCQLIIIGIGLNINTCSQSSQIKIDRPWCSLRDITKQLWCRNQLIGTIFSHLDTYIHRYVAEGLNPFMHDWKRVDWLSGQVIQAVLSDTQHLQGIASGINESGQLCICDENGTMQYLSSGEITRLFLPTHQ